MLKITSLVLMGGLFFSLPVSTASTNLFFTILIISSASYFLWGAIFKQFFLGKLFLSKESTLFWGFFLFILVISLAVSKTYEPVFHGIRKYFEILTIPFIAIYIFKSKLDRHKVVNFFSLAMIVTLIFSYAMYIEIAFLNSTFIKDKFSLSGFVSNPTVFKLHITQNFFMSMALLVWGVKSFQSWAEDRMLAIFYLVLCLLGFVNVFFMVFGRTGYLVILVALVYWMFNKYKYRGFIYSSLMLGVGLAALIYVPSTLQSRLIQGFNEVLFWNSNQASVTSMGLRLEFIFNSMGLSVNNLFLGTGIGSFPDVYRNYIAGKGMIESVNPHNQYILFLVETGLVGLSAFLYFNVMCWNYAGTLSIFWKHATRIVLLSYGVANLFNSFLFDFSESLFFSAFMALAFSELLQKKNEVNSMI